MVISVNWVCDFHRSSGDTAANPFLDSAPTAKYDRDAMVKAPRDTEVIMYGEKGPQMAPRAEIISFDGNGKPIMQQGGVNRTQPPPAATQPSQP